MSGVRVSIIVPTRGRPVALIACVAALVEQERPPGGYEIIVVDDGDGLPPLPAEVRIVSGEGVGPAAARNRGAAVAAGDVLAFTDDDCVASPGWVRGLDDAVRREPDAGAAGATVNGYPNDAFAVASQLTLDAAHAHFAVAGEPRFAASCNLAVPAAAFRALGGFDPGFRHVEDRDFCARWHASGRRLVWADGAEVVHRRRMGLGGFVSQHVGYGRGAYALHRRMAGVGIVPTPEPGFYALLAAHVRRASGRRARLAALAALSQAAAAAGFGLEGAAAWHEAGSRGHLEPEARMPVASR